MWSEFAQDRIQRPCFCEEHSDARIKKLPAVLNIQLYTEKTVEMVDYLVLSNFGFRKIEFSISEVTTNVSFPSHSLRKPWNP